MSIVGRVGNSHDKKEVRLMQAHELLVRELIAERHLEADRNRLARLVRQVENDRSARVQPDRREDWAGDRFLPVLRGYPVDPYFAR